MIELREETQIPIRFVTDLLFEMIDAGLLIEVNSDEKGEESRFIPAQDINSLTLGTLIDRLEARGTWKVDLDISKLLNEEWTKVLAIRKNYLSSARALKLQNL